MREVKTKEYFQSQVYGYIPPAPEYISGDIIKENKLFCAGKATLQRINLKIGYKSNNMEVPFYYCYPNNCKQNKTVVFLNFTDSVPDKYLPAEEIIDNGWAIASLCYENITEDNGDFQSGLAKFLKDTDSDTAPGKIAMWAWGAMRVMDYLQTLNTVDKYNIGLVGHSRLGKTALLTAAFDERFAFVHSNESGAGGAALFGMANEKSEHIGDLIRVFPFWFCENFKKYIDCETNLPYDQDELLKLIAPRVLSVGSAVKDLWANPHAECQCAKRASEKWESLGHKGLTLPEAEEFGVNYHDGKVGYYVRQGTHYLSREDWNRLLSFFDKNLN